MKCIGFSDLYLQTAADQEADYYLGTYVLLGIGAVITIMGFLGCCGAWKESPWMLGTVSECNRENLS